MTAPTHSQESLSEYLRRAREDRRLSFRDLADASGLPRSTLLDLEQGRISNPKPAVLAALASALDVPLADLYAAAGYELPTELPTIGPYLRSKYRHLPESAQRELEQTVREIARKHGYDANGPAPGEDEQ